MAPKRHPTPLSGGDRKALSKELGKSCAMASILAERAIEKRREGKALIGEADDLLCQSWNERPRWRDGIESLSRRCVPCPISPRDQKERHSAGHVPSLDLSIDCILCLKLGAPFGDHL